MATGDLHSGVPVYGLDFPPSQFDQDWTTIANVTSTSVVVGTPEVAVKFTAASSGRALIAVGCGVRNNAATAERLTVSFRVLEDDIGGGIFLDHTERNGVKSNGIAASQDFVYRGNFALVEGMTPGKGYFAVVTHVSLLGDGTADISSRNITVIPVP